ncbi:MAG: response regulator transcription factor [Bacteroidales bacterium]|nr:response regulator transcription factor [Bacteroidales bacterium]
MNILIIEDEQYTAQRLEELLLEYDSGFNIVAKIPSVEKAVKWFSENNLPDLIFQDIVLSDGNCFEIYDKISIETPIVFTTAYSEYALQSFKLNSIDYIVKPYDFADLKRVMEKFNKFSELFKPPVKEIFEEVLLTERIVPKKRFLIKTGDNYFYINSSDIVYFWYDSGLTYALTKESKKLPIDYPILEIAKMLDVSVFFQINRKEILNIYSIKKISTWFTNRLIVTPIFENKENIIVSRDRVKAFKEWLNQ